MQILIAIRAPSSFSNRGEFPGQGEITGDGIAYLCHQANDGIHVGVADLAPITGRRYNHEDFLHSLGNFPLK